MMAETDFEATWRPRIGKDATEELRRYRRSGWFVVLGLICAIGVGALAGEGIIGDVISGMLAISCVVCVGTFIRAQWRTAAAISVWFGVKRMRWLPRMTPQRFDEWCRLRGLTAPDNPVG